MIVIITLILLIALGYALLELFEFFAILIYTGRLENPLKNTAVIFLVMFAIYLVIVFFSIRWSINML